MFIKAQRLVSNLFIWIYKKFLRKKESFPFDTNFSKQFLAREKNRVNKRERHKIKTFYDLKIC